MGAVFFCPNSFFSQSRWVSHIKSFYPWPMLSGLWPLCCRRQVVGGPHTFWVHFRLLLLQGKGREGKWEFTTEPISTIRGGLALSLTWGDDEHEEGLIVKNKFPKWDFQKGRMKKFFVSNRYYYIQYGRDKQRDGKSKFGFFATNSLSSWH